MLYLHFFSCVFFGNCLSHANPENAMNHQGPFLLHRNKQMRAKKKREGKAGRGKTGTPSLTKSSPVPAGSRFCGPPPFWGRVFASIPSGPPPYTTRRRDEGGRKCVGLFHRPGFLRPPPHPLALLSLAVSPPPTVLSTLRGVSRFLPARERFVVVVSLIK